MSTQPEPAQFNVNEWTIEQMWSAFDRGEITRESLTEGISILVTAAARAEVARLRTHLRNLAFAVDAENIDAYTDDVQAAYRAALLGDAAPRQPEPEEPCPYCGGSGLGCMQCRGRRTVGSAFRQNRGLPPYQPAAPDTTTGTQQPPEVREPER